MRRFLPLMLVLSIGGSVSGAGKIDVTFLFTSDTHYGLGQWADNEAFNKQAIDRMNAIPGTSYPASAGRGSVQPQ